MSSIRIVLLAIAVVSVKVVVLAAPSTRISSESQISSFSQSLQVTHHPLIYDGSPRIVNGSNAAIGQFPYQVSLRELPFKHHFCGGSIITNRWILTAAHCMSNHATYEIIATVGSVELSGGGVEYEISEKRLHSEYVADQLGHDIALLRTVNVIVFNNLVRSIALPIEDTRAQVPAIISGWGRVDVNDITLPNHLQYRDTTIISSESCRSQLPNAVADFDELICHWNGFGGACHGDSGKSTLRQTQPIWIILCEDLHQKMIEWISFD